MILLEHKHWQALNRMAVEIHRVRSRDELVGLVAEKLPVALGAEEVCWSEHEPVVSANHNRSSTSCQDAILALIFSIIPSGHPTVSSSPEVEHGDANHGVFDVTSLISSRLKLDRSAFAELDQETQARHQIATWFFVDGHRGILLTVQNSRPSTVEQKFALSLLREHLAIAARRHYLRASDPMVIHPSLGEPALSRREAEVLPYLAKGFTNPEIANSLGISPRTVEKHVAAVLNKCGMDNRRMLINRDVVPAQKTHDKKIG